MLPPCSLAFLFWVCIYNDEYIHFFGKKKKMKKIGFLLSKEGILKMWMFCSVEKEERKEDEKEKKVRKKAVALKGEGIITSTKMTKKKNGKSKPGKKIEERVDSPSEDIDDGGDDYQPPPTQIKSEDGVGIGGERRRRRRRKKEERGALSPKMDFYYYSGFGPLWGKKRGDGAMGNTDNAIRVIPPSSSSSSSDHDRDDEHHKDEEDGDDDVDVIDSEWNMEEREKKKNQRVGRRKRVKARSLKSLL